MRCVGCTQRPLSTQIRVGFQRMGVSMLTKHRAKQGLLEILSIRHQFIERHSIEYCISKWCEKSLSFLYSYGTQTDVYRIEFTFYEDVWILGIIVYLLRKRSRDSDLRSDVYLSNGVRLNVGIRIQDELFNHCCTCMVYIAAYIASSLRCIRTYEYSAPYY
jgi:hypothetical protein